MLRLPRRKGAYMFVVFVSVAVIIIIPTLFYATTPEVSNSSYSVTLEEDTFASSAQEYDLFVFQDVNESQIALFPKTSIGQSRRLFFHEQSWNASQETVLNYFQPVISPQERQIMLFLFQTFIRACLKFNITYFLYSGTLLGSFRHYDIIPWDDDIDVIVNSSDRDSLRQAVSFQGNQFDLYSPRGERWKFFWTYANTLPHKRFRWPYIDIFFYSENTSHIYDEEFRQSFAYPKQHVFPLSSHRFAGAMLPVPCKLKSVVETNYSPDLCASLKFSHKLESFTPVDSWVIIPCKRLYRVFPFVHRRFVGDVIQEELVKDDNILMNDTIPAVCS